MSTIVESDSRVYLDYAATTPIDPGVLEEMFQYFSPRYSNASSMHTSGRAARRAIEQSRKDIAQILVCAPEEIIFTGSGTESDNLAIFGVMRANRARGNHLIVSAIEHKAVLQSARELEKEGCEVSILPVDRFGRIDVEACMRLVRNDTVLISVMYANNEIGTIEPIHELAAALRKHKGESPYPFLHTDACQAAGSMPLDVNEIGVDLMTLNGSKIYGPRGVGLLYKKTGVRIRPLIVGGEQERQLRAGTESVPFIVGCSAALCKAERMRERESARLAGLRDYFLQHLRTKIPNLVLNGHPRERLPNNLSISIPFVEGEAILLMLDKVGVEASTGSACSAHDLKPSHVLLATGQPAELAHGSIRFSLGRSTTKEKLDYVLSVFPPIVERLARISSLTAVV